MAVNWGLQGEGFNALQTLQAFGQAQQQGLQRQQMALAQQERERAAQERQAQMAARQQAAQQLGAGQYQQAATTAATAGDNQFADFVMKSHDSHRRELEEQSGLIGSVAARLKSVPADQRGQVFASIAPQLAQRGFDPQQLASVDLSDGGLDGYIAMATDAKTALAEYAKAQQPFTLGGNETRYDANGQVIARGVSQPKWQFDSESGSWLQEPGSGYAGAQPQAAPAPGANGGTFQRMIGAESGGQQFARNGSPLTSPAGAIGIAQVMPATGPEAARAAGLPWDEERFRNDPEYNSRLGNAYYQKQLQAFDGDEAKAVAAYNAGPGRVREAVRRGGENWQAALPQETKGYLAKVLGGGQQAPAQGQPGVVNVRPPKSTRGTDGAPSGYRYNGDRLEPIPGGPADPATSTRQNAQGNRKAEADFRKEFEGRQEVKDFRKARTQFNALRDTALNPKATAQDDIAVIFQFMKTLDPTSTVREGEFATASNAGGVPETLRNAYSKAVNGERLTPRQRQEMARTAYRSYQSFRDAYNNSAEEFRSYAKDNGINADRVARTYRPDKPAVGNNQPRKITATIREVFR